MYKNFTNIMISFHIQNPNYIERGREYALHILLIISLKVFTTINQNF